MQKGFPTEKIKNWIEEERTLGSEEASNIVLATAGSDGKVHSRVVAIREITDNGILFFTQQRSRKAKDLLENPFASMTLWLPLGKREIVLDGKVQKLSNQENERYWDTLSRERQLRFLSYQSGEPIDSLHALQNDYNILEKKFYNQKIPVNEKYCGYCLHPNIIYFYTLNKETFSEAMKYVKSTDDWQAYLVSP